MNFGHLAALTTELGVFEHCDGQAPLPEHGYCVDDVARALVVIERADTPPAELSGAVDVYLTFLCDAQQDDGTLINRRSIDGTWTGEADLGDHWGRALWAWGTVIGRSANVERVERALDAFRRSAACRSSFMRSMAHAALGADEYLRRFPHSPLALELLEAVRDAILGAGRQVGPWPQARLSYANAVLPQALIAAGLHLDEPDTLDRGLEMLEWLIDVQSADDHLSIVGHRGWAPGEAMPAFDQQPLEIAHLVDACLAAYDATLERRWLALAQLGGLWFYGVNDLGAWMHDPRTGGGFDGLTPRGPNMNCGAESTLAYLSSLGQLLSHHDALRGL